MQWPGVSCMSVERLIVSVSAVAHKCDAAVFAMVNCRNAVTPRIRLAYGHMRQSHPQRWQRVMAHITASRATA